MPEKASQKKTLSGIESPVYFLLASWRPRRCRTASKERDVFRKSYLISKGESLIAHREFVFVSAISILALQQPTIKREKESDVKPIRIAGFSRGIREPEED